MSDLDKALEQAMQEHRDAWLNVWKQPDHVCRWLPMCSKDIASRLERIVTLFTTESLAAAVDRLTHYDPDANVFALGPSPDEKMMTHEFAAAVIQSAKGAERE